MKSKVVQNLCFGLCLFWMSALSFAAGIQFAVIGDFGDDSDSEAKVAKLLKSYHPEFIITLGDNNYQNGCWETIDTNIGKYYQEYIGNYKGNYGQGAAINRFFPSLGNHDWNAMKACPYEGNLPYLAYFSLPDAQRYYDFVQGPVHFFALDSDPHEADGNTPDSKQYQWFAKSIKASKAPFKVVYFHHPPYSSGHHTPSQAMRWNFAELGADVVMAGHEHVYERLERDGIPYIVNGAGGRYLSKLNEQDPASQVFYSDKHGFMIVEANDYQLKMQFITTENEIIDTRVIERKS